MIEFSPALSELRTNDTLGIEVEKKFIVRWTNMDGPQEFQTDFRGEALFLFGELLEKGNSFTVVNFSNW